MSDARIIAIDIDEASLGNRGEDIEREKRVASTLR